MFWKNPIYFAIWHKQNRTNQVFSVIQTAALISALKYQSEIHLTPTLALWLVQ